MKKVLFLLLFAGGMLYAQTIINTPNVSGNWTLAGSPYIVQIPVTVAAGQVLMIDAGVTVKFEPSAKIRVNGQLMAEGTGLAPITFEATDTNGWHDDTTPVGGWNGIHFHQYFDAGTDLSKLDHCIIKDCKYGYNYANMYSNACSSERGIKIHNCSFTHIRTGNSLYVAEPPLLVNTYLPADTVDIFNCEFAYNSSVFGQIQNTNYAGGATRITYTHIHHNELGPAIFSAWNNLLIENCEINDNHMENDAGAISLRVGTAIVRNNVIHHNEGDDHGGIVCSAGRITIENNLICNNRQNEQFCGISGGGAGINLSHNDGSSFYDTYYIVRNNIIANNYAAYGGGGMYVFSARATIANNHIVNNYTPNQGQELMILNPQSEVYIKNNLFHTQVGPGNIDTVKAVYILSANKIQFDNNYIPSGFHKSVQAASGYTLVGDTLNNVIGTAPGMVSPTTDNNYTTNALTADFSLTALSPCIDEGDTADAFPSNEDYAGNARIASVIDIGAYEYGSGPKQPMGIPETGNASSGKIYPNPTSCNNGFYFASAEGKGQISIYELTGKMVYQQEIQQEKQWIPFSPGSQGIYIVHFYGKNNETYRLIVQ